MTETITRTMIEQREAAVLTGHRALTSGQLHAATVKSYPARGAVRLVHARLTRWRSPGTTIAIMGRLRTSYIRPTRGMPSVRGGGSAGTGFASDHVLPVRSSTSGSLRLLLRRRISAEDGGEPLKSDFGVAGGVRLQPHRAAVPHLSQR